MSVTVVLSLLASLCLADNFNVTANVHFNKVSNLHAAPDGKTFAFTARKWIENNTYKTILYCQTIDETEPTALTDTNYSVSEFAWDPTSTVIAFTSSTDSKILYTVDITTKTVSKAKEFPVEISFLKWGESGKIFTFAASVYAGMTMNQTNDFDNQKSENYPSTAMAYDSAPVYRWDSFFTGTYQHIHYMRVTADGTNYTFGDATDIMPNYAGDCPAVPQGESSEYSISPDEKFIAYATQPGVVSSWSVRMHIYLYPIPAEGSTEPVASVCLTSGRTGHNTCPVFSPDSRYVAILSGTSDIDESYPPDLLIIDLATRETRTLLTEWDQSPSDIIWSSHIPSKIFVQATVRGETRLFPVSFPGGKVDESNTIHSIGSAFIINSTHMLYTKSSWTHPPDVYAAEITQNDTYTDTQITDMNKDAIAAFDQELYAPENITFTGADGDTVQAWYFKPRSLAKSSTATLDDQSTPLLVWIHGGPESAWTDSWSDRWNPEAFLLGNTDMEFAMLLPNIHGSTGFGKAFMDSVKLHWHTRPLQDVIAARKYALEQYSYLDPNRTAAMGGSFGGYMVNLLQGQATAELNPFVCLICHDGTYDQAMHGFESDIFYFGRSEFGAYVWENRTLYDEASPSHQAGAGNWHTPELILHGLNDYRVARGQGIGMFNVLQRCRQKDNGTEVQSRLILYTNENHWCTKPADSIHWHQSCIGWLNTYLSKEESNKTMAKKLELSARYLAAHPQKTTKTDANEL